MISKKLKIFFSSGEAAIRKEKNIFGNDSHLSFFSSYFLFFFPFFSIFVLFFYFNNSNVFLTFSKGITFSCCIILGGTNDLFYQLHTTIFLHLSKLYNIVKQKNPSCLLVAMTVPPGSDVFSIFFLFSFISFYRFCFFPFFSLFFRFPFAFILSFHFIFCVCCNDCPVF